MKTEESIFLEAIRKPIRVTLYGMLMMTILRTKNRRPLLAIVPLLLASSGVWAREPQTNSQNETKSSATEIVLASEIQWQHLNPARGDASPAAGTLWGDQTKDRASGFLVKFNEGFSSPPHIHNITYRGIVLSGQLHNDDPDAKPMWMPAGSWWVQPAGEVHITAARTASVGYVEIQSGPYLVKAPEEAFDNGERPINVDASNTVWLGSADTNWIAGTYEQSKTSNKQEHDPKLMFLWGNPGGDNVVGTLVKLPAGFDGVLQSDSPTTRVVVIKGTVQLGEPKGAEAESKTSVLPTGSYFGSQGPSSHRLSCDHESLIYVRTEGKFTLTP